jgi:ABC-2 type transport system permease protein
VVSFMMLATLQNLRFSPQYEAAWVYYGLPIRRPGEVLMAALKGMMARFMVPMYMLVALIVGAIWGWGVTGDLVVAGVSMVFMSVLGATFLACRLPFSEAFGAMEGSGRMGKNMLLMMIPAAIGGIHYACSWDLRALLALFVALLIATGLLARRYGQMSWEELRQAAA